MCNGFENNGRHEVGTIWLNGRRRTGGGGVPSWSFGHFGAITTVEMLLTI